MSVDMTTFQQDRAAVVMGVGVPARDRPGRGTPPGGGGLVPRPVEVSAAGADEITLELLAHGARAEGAVTDISSAESIAAAFANFDRFCHKRCRYHCRCVFVGAGRTHAHGSGRAPSKRVGRRRCSA